MKQTTDSPVAMDRRNFVKVGALLGGGLLVSTYVDLGTITEAWAAPAEFAPNAFITISPAGAVTIIAPNSEMGQGIKTSLPMIVAEELDVPWTQVTVKQGDLNPLYGRQTSVGSQSTPSNYNAMRVAGASARFVLVQAAAEMWGVPASECVTENGSVVHRASNKRSTYGELSTKAAALTPPANVPLKDPKDFKLLGTRVSGVDNQKIVTGQPLFGIDHAAPGILCEVDEKCPMFGGKPTPIPLIVLRAPFSSFT